MSIRVYNGPHSDRHSGPPPWIRRIPIALAALTIVLQIAWPLTHDGARAAVTILVVWCFFLACLSHAWLSRGPVWALIWTGISLAFGFAVEWVGTRTGLPFGTYRYSAGALGWSVAGIPVVIPLAWAMMSYPALLVGRRLGPTPRGVIVISAWALASWDFFLDPQMVGERYWTWDTVTPALPWIPGIPLINFVGWVVASLVLMLLLTAALPERRGGLGGQSSRQRNAMPDGVPALLYLWTWIGGIVANLFFLGRPAVAITGGIAMGIVAIPYALRLTERSP